MTPALAELEMCDHFGCIAEFKDNILMKMDLITHFRIPGKPWWMNAIPIEVP